MRSCHHPLFAALLTVAFSGCSTSTTETLGGRNDAAFRQDVNTDAATVGGDDATLQSDVDVAALCGAFEGSDGVWTPETSDFVMRDRETGTLWNVRGQAFAGPCAGAQLAQIPAFTVFWFSWSASRHGQTIWNQDTLNQSAPIEPNDGDDCEVPCSEIRSGGPPPDGIPALDHEGRWERPKAQQMVPPDHPDAAYLGDLDVVLGVARDGESRAYPHALLNWHENHIDAINGVEYNVTYCPLTGSGILLPADQGGDEPLYMFVSGRLYNDNLTMFERDVDDPTFWNQVLLRGIGGPRQGEALEHWPIVETTWARWQEMYPNTLVSSGDTGYSQSLRPNPYSSRQEEDAGTLLPINPQWDDRYPNKSRVLSVDYQVDDGGVGDVASHAYPFAELDTFGDRVVVNDTLENDLHVLVIYEAEHRMAIPFDRRVQDVVLTFDGASAP